MDPGARTLQSNYHAPLLVSIFRGGSVVWAREEETRPLRLRWAGWVGLGWMLAMWVTLGEALSTRTGAFKPHQLLPLAGCRVANETREEESP